VASNPDTWKEIGKDLASVDDFDLGETAGYLADELNGDGVAELDKAIHLINRAKALLRAERKGRK
jgi:hypothetical protein